MMGALLITVLIIVNALFVAAEFAIVGAPRAAIERRAKDGHAGARRVARVLDDPRLLDRTIATAQLGITAASLGLGMVGEHMLAEALLSPLDALGLGATAVHSVASVGSIAILTYLHIVFGEMIPKALALQSPERLVLLVTPPVLLVERALIPLVSLFNGIGNLVLRVIGVERTRSSEHVAGPEELTFIVEESQEEGLLRGETGDMLRRLLAFSDRTAGEVMVPRVRIHGLRAGSTLETLRRTIRATQHTRYPIFEGDLDHIVGMVHIKALVPCLVQHRGLQASDVLPVPFVPETLSVGDVLATMRRERTQVAIVMDEHGGTAGLVTTDDLFEEVVGIMQETADESPFQRRADGLIVKGTVRLDELGEELDIALEHEEVDTVSGLVLALLKRPPETGDSVTYDHVVFEVTAVDGHGVGACRVASVPFVAEGEAAD